MLVAVVTAYALSWMPLHVITLVGDSNPEIYNKVAVHMTWLFAHWLAFSNCAMNPIIYCWMNSAFRSSFLYMFRKVTCYAKRRRKPNKVCRSSQRTTYFSSYRTHDSLPKQNRRGKYVHFPEMNSNHTVTTC